ncbi:MAG: DNA alkylation repair protein [Saprospiraceae bacterium]
MKRISKKSEVQDLTCHCISTYHAEGLDSCIQAVYSTILSNKIKFPLLEFAATELFQHIKTGDQLSFLNQIQSRKTIGGNVITGIILQKRLKKHFKQTINKATEYIGAADAWYVCDIIGERVWGFSLLQDPDKTIKEILRLSAHPNQWVIRSLGAGAHYSIKKGLDQMHVKTLFDILLSMANTTNKEIRQGVGWAAKTTAKFHPEIINDFKEQIQQTEKIKPWFRTKIKTGLDRGRYKELRIKNEE